MSKMFNYEADHIHDLVHPDLLTDTSHYVAECIDIILTESTPNYPKLCDYEKEWLYFAENEYQPGHPENLEYQEVNTNGTATVLNVIPFSYKSAILKGSTKYRDIDTGDILDTFDETKNLELVSVRMPVLTTSNGDGTKTNILSTSEDVELRGIGDVKDELNLLTGEVVERIGEIVLDGSQTLQPHSTVEGDTLMIKISDPSISFKQNSNQQESWDFSDMICDKELIAETKKWNTKEWNKGYNIALISSASSNTYNINSFVLAIRKTYFNVQSIDEFKTWLTQNPLTIQYKLAKESIKTVDLNTVIKPYEGTNHYTVSSETIPPHLQIFVPVESTGAQTLHDITSQED